MARHASGRGRHLPPVPAATFLPCVPAAIAAGMASDGMRLVGNTRPFLAPDGVVAVRLVWRRPGASATLNFSVRGVISDDFWEALGQAKSSHA